MIARIFKAISPVDYLTMLCILILSVLTAPSRAATPTVATCPMQVAGTVWPAGSWLPCPTIVNAPIPVPPSAIVADMSVGGAVFSWQLASMVLPTDSVWNNSIWVPASSAANFSVAGSATPPPVVFTAPAVLSWTAPTANVDGSTPANLAGYNIYSGPSAAGLTLLASVGLAQLSYTATVGVGTTYFTVTAYSPDVPALESAKPAVVSKTVAAPKSPSTPGSPGNVAVK